MKKILYILSVSLILQFSAEAQLKSGEIAPNWTLTDLNGNVHTLYDYLDEGKFVVLDFSATWCGPCWGYHNSGAMKTFYNAYGPAGTDEAMVFYIEADLATTTANLNGTGNTQGNWVINTPYPIIDLKNSTVSSAYKIGYFPTIYMVYPNRSIYEIGQAPFSGLRSNFENMPRQATDDHEVKLMNIDGSTLFCNENSKLGVRFQNYGLEPLESATFNVIENGIVIASQEWTGNLPKYGVATMKFDDAFNVTDNMNIDIKVETADQENFEFSTLEDVTLYSSPELMAGKRIKLQILANSNGDNINWELKTGTGGIQLKGDDLENGKLYTYTVILSVGQCYQFNIYNSEGSGLGNGGYYRILDKDENLLLEVNDFESKSTSNFLGSTTTSTELLESMSSICLKPNPVTENLQVQLDIKESARFQIKVVSLVGSVLYTNNLESQSLNGFNLVIPTENYQPGVYFLIITDGVESIARKFIKK